MHFLGVLFLYTPYPTQVRQVRKKSGVEGNRKESNECFILLISGVGFFIIIIIIALFAFMKHKKKKHILKV